MKPTNHRRDIAAATANYSPLPPGGTADMGGGTRSIKWQRSPSGATHQGSAGDQTFVVMPDGSGGWILNEIDETGRAHILEHSLPSDWSAMAAALDYVHIPIRWPMRLLVVGALTLLAGVVYALTTL